ncbi:MAG: hypothetical protein A2087_07050 [Spirochaetes bacterium GWD1_61_31]|nr:MAG: hypothetical protein A2Y37_08420 [Spirochaetes bacterium GWB1_60_80]OHD28485.1 MAG: hypothetical protein A2004_14840 [Spirochaetes bacterium GWC1_61_12]OHD40102.1 MAG: hypothetical protein A2087_07050 [Spirochaetes bacterium GWD1_61_31]OHD45850.1 MAG: hypothetical protein A2Y35_04055 [Spirochaetes bacterium GWE1_60_18]OHD58393.1 MAG: hypothetical protein A2Y32_06445 [Spirochaetes bacterium GWF1_60_12]HAW85371.1 hypothetical protein [Spirochaetaceae bacterium]
MSSKSIDAIASLPEGLRDTATRGQLDSSIFNPWAHKTMRSMPEVMERTLDTLVANPTFYLPEFTPWLSFWRGWLLHNRSDYNNAIKYHWQAYEIFEANQDALNQAKTAHALAASLKYQGFFDRALEWAEKGLAAATALNDVSLVAALLANIGEALIHLNRHQEADTYLHRALEFNPSDSARLVITQKLSELAIAQQKPELALDLAVKALRQSERMNLPILHAQTIAVYAKALATKGSIRKAKGQFSQAVRLAEKIGDRINTAEFLLGFGQVCFAHGDKGSALAFLGKALGIAQDLKASHVEGRIHQTLAAIHKAAANWQEAFLHQEAFLIIRQQLYNQNADTALRDLTSTQAFNEAEIYRKLYDRISAIAEAGREITSVLELGTVLERVYKVVQRIMPAEVFGLAIRLEDSELLDYTSIMEGNLRIDAETIAVQDKQSLEAWCFRHGQEILINDLSLEGHKYGSATARQRTEVPTAAFLLCPLLHGKTAIGVVTVQARRANAYNRYDQEGLRALALYIAIALENARLYKAVERSASHDHLTGVLNRYAILKAGLAEHTRQQRYGGLFSVLLIEIDDLKFINGSLGLSTGDAVLKHVVKCLQGRLRGVDTIGRYGGEEFIVILPETGPVAAQEVAATVLASFAAQLLEIKSDCLLRITACIGLYSFEDPKISFDIGIQKAGSALDQAKAQGPGILYHYTPADSTQP